MSLFEKRTTFLLVAAFALLLIPCITVPATETIYFARFVDQNDISDLRVGMWGACSTDLSLGDGARDLKGCTPGNGAYSLMAELPVDPSYGNGSRYDPPKYLGVDFFGSGSTGPILCLLVSFLLIAVSFVPWLHAVFRPQHRLVRVNDLACWVLWLVSLILAWAGFGNAGHLKSELQSGLDEYRNSGAALRNFSTSYGNATWCSLVAGIVLAILWVGQCVRLYHQVKARVRTGEAETEGSAKDEAGKA